MITLIHNSNKSGFVVEKILQITLFALIISLILSVFRIAGLTYLANNNLLNVSNDFIGKSLLMGFRYDAKFSVIILIPIVVVVLITVYFRKIRNKFFSLFSKIYMIIIGLLVIIIEIINYNYFKFFKTQLNIDFFGIFYDDTSALVSSISLKYPLLLLSLFFLLILSIFAFLIFLILKINIKKSSLINSIIVTLLFLIISFYFARGSFSGYPLRHSDRAVSVNLLVNEFVMNSPMALIDAYKDLKRVEIELNIDKILSENGYASLQECLSDYSLNVGNEIDSLFIYKSSKKEDEFVNPNVVVIFMEGMGSVFFKPISKTNDFIGELGNQLDNCDFFLKAMPNGHITYSSLDGFLFATVDGPLSQSKYSLNTISSSVALPFKNSGYETSFITGGKLDWRNYGSFLKNQGFDFCEGMEIISAANTDVEIGQWGVYDEYLFDFMFDKLVSQTNPQFIFALTTTNHTPYTLPKNYKAKKIDITEFEKYLSIEDEQFERCLSVFDYAAHYLGVFLKRLSESEFAENTIVVITGDHNMREAFSYPVNWQHKNLAVPIIFKVPESYKPQIPDTSKWISHRDIRSTIYELALSEQEYFATGVNIYDSIPDDYYAVRTNNMAFSNVGLSNLSNNINYNLDIDNWNGNFVIETEENLQLINQMQSVKAYRTLLKVAQANNLKK